MAERVKEAIRLCYSEGFRKEDLAIVSWRGREHSRLIALERLGANTLKHFTGEYDLLGEPRYTAGDVLVESVPPLQGAVGAGGDSGGDGLWRARPGGAAQALRRRDARDDEAGGGSFGGFGSRLEGERLGQPAP